MSGVENNNGSTMQHVVLLLRSRLHSLSSFFSRTSKLKLSALGIATLAAVPVAAVAFQGSTPSANLNTSTDNEISNQPQAPLTEAATPVPTTVSSESNTSNGDSHNNATTNTQVTVNGQAVPVPENGSVHKTIDTGNSQVTVNVDNTTATNASPGSSYTSVQSFSSSTSSNVNVNQNTTIGGTSSP